MSIWNKVLLGVICVALLPFFYLAGRALKTHQHWSTAAEKFQARIKQVKAENEKLFEGEEVAEGQFQPGIRQLRQELHKLQVDSRRTWRHCSPRLKIGEADGTAEIVVTIEGATPHGIAEKTVLYAFEEVDTAQKGNYLGEFRVTGATDKQVTIVPTFRLTPREIAKLKTAKIPWTITELMPQDGRLAYATRTDEQKRSMLPPGTVAEYLKDGKPAAADDPREQVVDGKYVRPLRDYLVLFNSERERNILLRDSIEASTRDKALTVDALAEGRKQEESCKRDIAAETAERAEAFRQRDIVAGWLKTVQDTLSAVLADVEQLIQKNQAMAGQIAKFQMEAARLIDQRTRAMAQTGTERL